MNLENNNGIPLSVQIDELTKDADGVMLTVTVVKVDKDAGMNRFTHHLIYKNFPLTDLLKCHRKCKELMVKELEGGSGRTVI